MAPVLLAVLLVPPLLVPPLLLLLLPPLLLPPLLLPPLLPPPTLGVPEHADTMKTATPNRAVAPITLAVIRAVLLEGVNLVHEWQPIDKRGHPRKKYCLGPSFRASTRPQASHGSKGHRRSKAGLRRRNCPAPA